MSTSGVCVCVCVCTFHFPTGNFLHRKFRSLILGKEVMKQCPVLEFHCCPLYCPIADHFIREKPAYQLIPKFGAISSLARATLFPCHAIFNVPGPCYFISPAGLETEPTTPKPRFKSSNSRPQVSTTQPHHAFGNSHRFWQACKLYKNILTQ